MQRSLHNGIKFIISLLNCIKLLNKYLILCIKSSHFRRGNRVRKKSLFEWSQKKMASQQILTYFSHKGTKWFSYVTNSSFYVEVLLADYQRVQLFVGNVAHWKHSPWTNPKIHNTLKLTALFQQLDNKVPKTHQMNLLPSCIQALIHCVTIKAIS